MGRFALRSVMVIASGLLALTGGSPAVAGEGAPPATLPTVPPNDVLEPAVVVPETGASATASAQAGAELVGVFAIEAGSCGGAGAATGSTFRMVQPGGSASGPFLSNSDSPCRDQTVTPLAPGSDGGLSTAAFQPNPAKAFDGGGGGTASAIVKPQKFMGVAFAVSTNDKDPQTGASVPKPVVTADNRKLTGDLRALSVAYNGQHFNQGSPKPDGSRPGLTGGPTGTYDATSGAFTLEWTSTIVGGPFNGFTGTWHLEGTFRGSSPGTSPAANSPAASGSTPGATESAPGPGGSTVAASTAGRAPRAGAPAHPNSGPTFSGAFGILAIALGSLGLLVRRRLLHVEHLALAPRDDAAPDAGR